MRPPCFYQCVCSHMPTVITPIVAIKHKFISNFFFLSVTERKRKQVYNMYEEKIRKEDENMAKGVIYIMTTIVPSLIKIGKAETDNFERRMYTLENRGYLKRRFAIEVENCDEKETLLYKIFSRSRIPDTELFALDVDIAVQLLSSFEGRQIFPKTETK